MTLANSNQPSQPALSTPDEAVTREFFDDVLLIAEAAGFDFFSPPKSPKKLSSGNECTSEPTPQEFILKKQQNKLIARGRLSDEGFVVLKNSHASATTSEGLNTGYAELHRKLLSQGVLQPKNGSPDLLTFEVDYAFSAPSAAASIILGFNASGPAVWKTREDVTLGDYLKQLESGQGAAPTTGQPQLPIGD